MEFPERYETVAPPRAGGMGSVFPCRDSVLERLVAIKIIHGMTDPRRIRDELNALLKMRSKHVVQVYDIIVDGDDFGIVQEFIDGDDLFSDRTKATSTVDYYKQLWQIASGISDIHDVGVIHRDIKPNNMKVDPEGVIKIFDFGLARDEGPDAGTVGFVGTPGFAAPELYMGPDRFTQAVDTYAFGASALFLATRTLPDELTASPPRTTGDGYFADLPFDLAPEISSVLDDCLAEDPADRPAMSHVKGLLSRHVLSGQHQALVVFRGQAAYLNATNRSVNLNLPGMGQIEIWYDDLDFRVKTTSGDVYVNNRPATVGAPLPESCVVALGSPARPRDRKFITFDLSHLEFVL